MKVLILGFESVNQVDAAMNKLIEESQCFLFTVVCGGLDKSSMKISIGEQWARDNGAPIEYLFAENPEKLINLLAYQCDYIVLKITDNTPRWHKTLLMKMKGEGKHGTIVK